MRARTLTTAVGIIRPTSNRVNLHSVRTPPKTGDNPTLPPVLLLHGVLASESTYRSIIKRPDFVPDREIIGVDMRNHGRSSHANVSDGMRYEDMAADLSHFLDKEGIEKASLIGHSMGGKVAMQLALTEPEKVSKLVVVDIAPVNYMVGKDASDPYIVAKAMRKVDMEKVTNRAEVDAQLLKHGVKSEAVRQFVMTNLVSVGEEMRQYRWKVNLEAVYAALPTLTAFPEHPGRAYDGATCVIRGGKSPYVPFGVMKKFIALFPRSKLVTISEAGHWLQAQAPDDFVRAVNDFLMND